MFARDSQMLHNKRHFVISVIAINVFHCISDSTTCLPGNFLCILRFLEKMKYFGEKLPLSDRNT